MSTIAAVANDMEKAGKHHEISRDGEACSPIGGFEAQVSRAKILQKIDIWVLPMV